MPLHTRFPYLMAEPGDSGSGSGSASDAAGAGSSSPPAGTASDALLQGGAGNLLDWRNSLPDNLRSAPILQQHPTLEGAAKTLVAQGELIGRGIYLPKEAPDTDEYKLGMQKVYDKLGRPAKPDAYTLPVPEGRTLDGEVSGRWQQAFYQAGLSQTQVENVMAEYWRTVQYAEQVRDGKAQESYQNGRTQLMGEFGANTERELTMAQQFFEHFGKGAFSGEAGSKVVEQLKEATLADGSRLINSPYLVATFAEAMRRMGEGEFLESSFYVPGQNTLQTLEARHKDLTVKRHGEGLSGDEMAELMRVSSAIVSARERQGARR